MADFLNNLPRPLLVFLALAVGILLIILMSPPHSICDIQEETLKETLKGTVFLDESRPKITITGLKYRHDLCWRLNNSGGCYEYFITLRSLIKDLKIISPDCWRRVGRLSEIEEALWAGINLFVRVAWGIQPPRTFAERAWLSAADLAIFCDLQDMVVRLYGKEALASFREKLMGSLPGVERLRREEIWARSILSLRCAQYR